MFIKYGWLIGIVLFAFVSCRQPNKVNFTALPSAAWMNDQINNYDSLDNIFYETDRVSEPSLLIRIKANEFLDTLLFYEQPVLNSGDTALTKNLIKAFYRKGTDLNDMGKYADALNHLNKYLLLFNNTGSPISANCAYVHKTMGNIYSRYGDYNLAIYHKSKALAYYRQAGNVRGFSSEINDISIAFRESGLYDSAIAYLKVGVTLNGIETKRLLTSNTELAKNYIKKKEWDSARIYLEKAAYYFIEWQKLNKGEEWRLQEYKSAEALLLTHEGRLTEALEASRLGLYFLEQQYNSEKLRDVGKAYNQSGYLYSLLNQKDSAIHYFNKALYSVSNIDTNNIFSLPQKNELYAENTIIEALEQKANWMLAYADTANAKKYLQCAVNCYDIIMDVEYKLLQNFSYDNSKLLMLKESRSRSEKAIGACYRLYETEKNNTWIEKAFQFAERNKSFILLESVKRNLAASASLQTDSTYLQLQQAQLNYANYEKEVIEANNKNDIALINAAAINLKAADEALQVLKLRSRYSNNSYTALLQKEDSISLKETGKLLPGKNTALLEYFIGDSAAYCFYIAAEGKAEIYKLTGSLSQSIDTMLQFFKVKINITDNPETYSAAAFELYKNLQLNKTGKQINRLIIIPDDKLGFVPFDALVTQPAISLNLASFSYLIKQFEISYGYSATMLLKQGNYTFKDNGVAVFTPVFAHNERGLNALQFSPGEKENIQHSFSNGAYFTDSSATLGNFKNHAPAAGIIHIATHAAAEGIPRIEFYDSTLYTGELYAMQLNANLVVLSACETGVGKIEKSEGAISLARGFYYAGAHSVITSLWSVDDESTAQLFGSFYSGIKDNNYNKALRQSKLDYLNSSISNNKYSPYYWAGFVYIGANETPENYTAYIIAAIILLLVSGIIIKYFFSHAKE